jgi:hypothetical protein
MTDIKITEEVRTRLAWLENAHGQLTPDVVLEDARKKNSPLHPLFEWDMKKAALQYLLWRARCVIHSVKMSVTTEAITLRSPVYVRDPSIPGNEQGYISVTALRKDPIQARLSIRLEFSRAESALTRAKAIAAALNMEEDIAALLQRLMGLRTLLDEDGPAPQEANH